MLNEVHSLEEASYIEPINVPKQMEGVTSGKIYDLHCGEMGCKIDEYHIIDDLGRRNHGVMFFKFKLYIDKL